MVWGAIIYIYSRAWIPGKQYWFFL
jgi:hypothetical protein